MGVRALAAGVAALLTWGASPAAGEDWPERRGKRRLGVRSETGLLDAFPEAGLDVRRRAPLRADERRSVN